ncbi:MAG: cysteine desulfurase family protein, partial [Oceanicaulis sp.]
MSVYLDHNATAPVRPEAAEAVAAALGAGGNPSSVHEAGRAARATVERARGVISRAVSARVEDVIFTSGGTEANNLAVHAAIAAGAQRIIVSAIEHDAVRASAEASGLAVETWPVDADGRARLDWLEAQIAQGGPKTLVCLMAANNETGVIQPVAEAGWKVREAGWLFHVDAVQALGKAGFDFAGSGAHFAAFSAHKAGGPQGIGALVAACDAQVGALIRGGGQEKGRRGGTENVAGIAGFAAAVEASLADSGEAARIAADRSGYAIAPAGLPAATVTAGATDYEYAQAKSDVEADLATLVGDTRLKDIRPELEGWQRALTDIVTRGTAAARAAVDDAQRSIAFAARQELGDYARLARLLGALTPELNGTYRSLARSLDEASSVILVMAGEAIAARGFGGVAALPAPVGELQARRDAVLGALRVLLGVEQQSYGTSEWP